MGHICAGCGEEFFGFSPHDFYVESSAIIQDINSLLIILPRTTEMEQKLAARLVSFKNGLADTRLVKVKEYKEALKQQGG